MSSLTDTQSAESSRLVESRPQLPHQPGQLTPEPSGEPEIEAPAPWPDVVATVREDGSAEVTIAGLEHRVHEDTLDLARDAIVAHVGEHAARAWGRPVRLLTTDPAGQWKLIVHPDGKIEAAEPSTYPTRGVAAVQSSDTHAVELEPAKAVDTDIRATQRPVRASRSFLTVHEDVAAAQHGWRGILTRLGLNSEPSDTEKAERADVRATSRHWPGPRTIAIVNGKGGAGKTPTTVILSSLFARNGGSGVLAWDNNETRGTLGWRTEQGPHEAHVLDLLPRAEALMQPTARAADLSAYVHHQVDDKYDVLRSNPLLLPHQQRLTAADFDAVHQVAAKYFRLIFVDSGNDETAPHWLQMISHADQLVVATTTRPDHAEAGRLLLDALRDRDEHARALADGAVVIVSQADREEASAATIVAGYEGLARQALAIPYDRAMRAPWLRYSALQPATRRAYLAAAAVVSEGL